MKPAQPEELSALLDGELSADRASEVEAQIAADPALRTEFEALALADASFRAAGASAVFAPKIEMPARPLSARSLAGFAILAAALAALRLIPKLMDAQTLGIAVHIVAIAALLAGVVWLARRQTSSATLA